MPRTFMAVVVSAPELGLASLYTVELCRCMRRWCFLSQFVYRV